MNIYFSTFGCKVNSSEDEFFLSHALQLGYKKAGSPEEADVIVVNGCAVTEKAASNVKTSILKNMSRNYNAKIIVTGCIVQDIEKEKENFPNIEIIANSKKNSVIDTLSSLIGGQKKDIPKEGFCGGIPDIKGSHTRAFFKIQDGCDAFCTYCVIPTLRGKPVSKSIEDAIEEFKKCVNAGFKEIVLVGIHIGLYGRGLGYNLTDLIKRLVAIKGDFRIRLSSIEVNEIDDELLSIMASTDKLCSHLHIPLQSGSKKILKAMERKYPPEQYIETVLKAKNKIPDLNVGSDVIVGFPTETQENFIETVKTIEKAGTDFLHVFPYSDRNGTKASIMEGKISEKEKENRSKILRTKANEILTKRCESTVGQTFRILTEKNNKCHSDNYFFIKIISDVSILSNHFHRVQVLYFENGHLFGKII